MLGCWVGTCWAHLLKLVRRSNYQGRKEAAEKGRARSCRKGESSKVVGGGPAKQILISPAAREPTVVLRGQSFWQLTWIGRYGQCQTAKINLPPGGQEDRQQRADRQKDCMGIICGGRAQILIPRSIYEKPAEAGPQLPRRCAWTSAYLRIGRRPTVAGANI